MGFNDLCDCVFYDADGFIDGLMSHYGIEPGEFHVIVEDVL